MRAVADDYEERFIWEARRGLFQPRWKNGLRVIGGGAPTLPVTLSTIRGGSVTANTFTGPTTILTGGSPPAAAGEVVGPFSVDYFKTLGATWRQECNGVVSTTATPTLAIGTYFGTVIGTITTVLAISPTQTTISGLANVDFIYRVTGVTKAISGTTATMLVQGVLISQIATAAANNIIQFVKNATPPSAVTTDLSSAVFLDIKATWSASSVSNSTVVNEYDLQALYF